MENENKESSNKSEHCEQCGKEVKSACKYKINGKITTEIPFDTEAPVEPVYTELPGWKEDISEIRQKESLPENLKGYIRFIENQLGIPVTIVSVGPDREAG